MFNKLFAPKLQHSDPRKRLAAINALSASEQDIATLSDLALNDPDSKVRDQALRRLGTQVCEQTVLDATTAVQLFRIAGDSMKQKLIGHIRDRECLEQCIAGTDDQRELMLLAIKSTLPQARKMAADRICGLDNLKQLQFQSNDKNVLQLVRHKINLIKTEQKALAAAQETLKQICETLERIAKSDFDPMMTSRVNILESRWQEMDDRYKTEFLNRYQRANNECHRLIRQAREQQALAEFEESQNELCQALCDKYENEMSQLDLETALRWPAMSENLTQQWTDLTRRFSPEVTIAERFYTLKSAADKVTAIIDHYRIIDLDTDSSQLPDMNIETVSEYEQALFRLTRQLSWPYKIRQPEVFEQIRNQHGQLKKHLGEMRNELKKKLARIDSKISILKSHIRQKNLIKANRMLNYIQNLIDELPESSRLNEHEKLQTVIVSLNELRGLNEFITQPKKLELCEQMEALVNKDIDPEKLINEIKRIQGKWKSLATSDAAADDVLWERFKFAADKAYLPCAAYLEDLENIKNRNLAARADLNIQLEKYLGEQEWEHVDWPCIQANYLQYWKQWRSMTPVFFSKNKVHQKKFEGLMAALKAKLDDEKTENHRIQDQLIDRVIHLAESLNDDNVDDAVEQVKRIQASWKNVGITHFKKSRTKWHKFQKYCDRVFEYQRSKSRSKRQQANQQLNQVYEVVKQIRALTELPDEQFAASHADFQGLVQAFEEIEVADSHKEKSQRLFDRACEDYQLHVSGLGERAKVKAHLAIRQAAALCARAEILAVSHAGHGELQNLKSKFEALSLDQNIAEKFTRRLEAASLILDNAENLDPDKLLRNEQALSELAVKLEVLFDLPTPEYALKQRMEYQLEQLQIGIKPALSNQEKQMKLVEFELDWYQVGAVDVEARETLERRLAAVIKQAEK